MALLEPSLDGETPRVQSLISAVGHSTKTDATYAELRKGILSGRILPGSVLEQEALAAALGMSTTPVREALRRLESETLVESVAFRKVRVTQLSLREFKELYAIRQVLDPLAASLAAINATEDEIDRTRRTLQTGDLELEDRLVMNRAFHRSIYAASGNGALAQLLDSLWDRTDRYRYVIMRHKLLKVHNANPADECHLRMVEALQARDAPGIAKLMTEHLSGSVDMMDAYPEIVPDEVS
jgi:DNA-binding GntR family transcriptional regulator